MWKVSFHPNRAFWPLNLVTRMSRELTVWPDYIFLSCSTLAVMTLQFPTCFTRVLLWRLASRESVVRSSHKTPLICTHLEFSLHSLTHNPYMINTEYLIAKIQANLAQNKANTWYALIFFPPWYECI